MPGRSVDTLPVTRPETELGGGRPLLPAFAIHRLGYQRTLLALSCRTAQQLDWSAVCNPFAVMR
jgi:hypothetical protein